MKNIISLFLLFTLSTAGPAYGNLVLDRTRERVKVFFTQNDPKGAFALVRGKVLSYSARSELKKEDLYGRALDKSKATVRLYTHEGVREGETLYVIDEKNMVVAKLRVRAVFKSNSFGYMAVGYGNFRLGSAGGRVVQLASESYSENAYIHKARGDYYANTGKEGEAMSEYKKALTLDRGHPEAHLAIGEIYMRKGMLQFAFKEFSVAYDNISRLYDNEDKFTLLKNMARIRFYEAYESYLSADLRDKYRLEGIEYSKKALEIYPESADMHYLMGVFYYRATSSKSIPYDVKARDHFLRVVELRPDHTKAYIGLSELYYRHGNMRKSRMYALKAAELSPDSQRARDMLRFIENYTKGRIEE